MANNLGYTPGTGATLRTVEVSAGVHLPLIDAPIRDGRAPWVWFTEALAGAAAEALVSMTAVTAVGTAGSAGNTYSVPAGKILRINAIALTLVATATTLITSKIRLRALASGTALVSSPIVLSLPRLAFETATLAAAEGGAPVVIPFPDGLEFAAGNSIALTHIESAAAGTIDIQATGFLYNAP